MNISNDDFKKNLDESNLLRQSIFLNIFYLGKVNHQVRTIKQNTNDQYYSLLLACTNVDMSIPIIVYALPDIPNDNESLLDWFYFNILKLDQDEAREISEYYGEQLSDVFSPTLLSLVLGNTY